MERGLAIKGEKGGGGGGEEKGIFCPTPVPLLLILSHSLA